MFEFDVKNVTHLCKKHVRVKEGTRLSFYVDASDVQSPKRDMVLLPFPAATAVPSCFLHQLQTSITQYF